MAEQGKPAEIKIIKQTTEIKESTSTRAPVEDTLVETKHTPAIGGQSTEYTFNHLGLHESLRKNVSMGFYEAGHMMYIHVPSLAALKKDLATFIRSTRPA